MKLRSTPIDGMHVVDTEPSADARGRFERLFCSDEWAELRPELRFVQINLSTTSLRGAVRGLHFQRAPALEAKLIRCVRGRAFDVAVDLRAGSPTFLRWHAVELREDEPHEVFLPEGLAHGFQALTDDVQLLYFHTTAYAPEHEGGLRYDDARLGVEWPLPVVQVSDRDRVHPLIDADFAGLPV